jgi:hypothetical protein
MNTTRLLFNLLPLLSNHLLDIKLQTVHLPLSDVEGLKEDLVGDVAPTPVHELHDRDVKSRILRKHHPQRVSESGDVLIPGSVQRGVQGDGLPVAGREEECRKNHDAVETEMIPDQDDRRSMTKPITYYACACIAVDKRYSSSADRSINSRSRFRGVVSPVPPF